VSTEHETRDGEHLAKIADAHGFANAEAVRAVNPGLSDDRLRGHVLAPGDVVAIPEHRTATESIPARGHHRFVLNARPLVLRVRFERFTRQPLTGEACGVGADGAEASRVTDAEGIAEAPLPIGADEGSFTLDVEPSPFLPSTPVLVGRLDPVDLATGQRGRLNNLGYLTHEDGEDDSAPPSRTTLEEFQRDHGLTVTGECDAPTRAALVREHGS